MFEDSGVNVSMLYWEDKFEQRVPDDHVIPVGERTLLFRKEIKAYNQKIRILKEEVTVLYESVVLQIQVSRHCRKGPTDLLCHGY